MKKVKIFKIINLMVLSLMAFNITSMAKENIKDVKKDNTEKTQQETKKEIKDDEQANLKDFEEYEVENFKIDELYKKGDTKLVTYEHIKSGAKFVVWFEDLESEAEDKIKFKDPAMFFRYIPTNNMGVAHVLEHFLAEPIEEKLKDKFTIHELLNIFGFNSLGQTPNFNHGLGFKFVVKKWSPEIVKIVTDELKNPTFLKDNKELFSREKKRMILELKQKGNIELSGKNLLCDRFIGGKFVSAGYAKDAEKLSFEYAKKEFEENIIPENILIQMSANLNPDYKEIMKSFDERYLKNYTKKNSSKKNKEKLNLITETEPVRHLQVEEIQCDEQNFKNKARLFWKIENLSPKEKEIFNMRHYKNPIVEELKNEIKILGYEMLLTNDYENIGINGKFMSTQFDNLFYLDLYGNDSSKFKEETLKENAKKILKMFYEKIKNFDESNLFITNTSSNGWHEYTSHDYRNSKDFSFLINKSFSLTGKPINEKFFDIEDNDIKDDYANTRILENLKKYKDSFEQIMDLSPIYIDIFTAKKSKDNEANKSFETKLKQYENPVAFVSSNEILKEWAEDLTTDLFLKPNINDKGLCYSEEYFPDINSLNTETNEIEKYLFGKFIKDFKAYLPTQAEFKKLNDSARKNNKMGINELENKIKNLNESLNNSKILKKLAEIQKQKDLLLEYNMKSELKWFEEKLKNEKNKKDIKILNTRIDKYKANIKKICNNKDNLGYYINKVKEEIQNDVKIKSSHLNIIKTKEELRSKIKYEDFVNIFKNAKIKTGVHLEKFKPELKKENTKV